MQKSERPPVAFGPAVGRSVILQKLGKVCDPTSSRESHARTRQLPSAGFIPSADRICDSQKLQRYKIPGDSTRMARPSSLATVCPAQVLAEFITPSSPRPICMKFH